MRGNTITIVMSDKRGKMAKTIPLYQYDYGQKLIIENVDLPDAYEVHFSNELHGESITMIGDSTGVDIPDQFITTGLSIYLWVFLHDSETDGETEYAGVIPVIKRAYPSDEEPTPEQQSVITQTIAALNAGVSTVNNAVENIGTTINTALAEAKASGQFDGADGQDGADGADGADGYSPTITTEAISGGYELIITDIAGTNVIDIMNGEPGQDGSDGEDGYSPNASVSKNGTVTTITITDKDGTTVATVNDGEVGPTPEITIGTVTTGAAGSDADVTITGTADSPVLNFTIPKGDTGDVQVDDTAGVGDTDVTWSADKSATELLGKYEKPSGGIPSTDLASGVQTSLGKADTAYQKPSGGIPSTDLASGVIPDVSSKLDAPSVAGTNGQVLTSDGQGGQSWKTPGGGGGGGVEIDDTAGIGDTDVTWSANKSATELATKYVKPSGGIPATDMASGVIPDISGKLDKPSSASAGDFLCYNGTAWVATTLSTWNGGNY